MDEILFVPGMETWKLDEHLDEVVEVAADAVITLCEAEETGVAMVTDDGNDQILLTITQSHKALVTTMPFSCSKFLNTLRSVYSPT